MDDEESEAGGTQRSVQGPAKKLFFNVRTFGQGENGESRDLLDIPSCLLNPPWRKEVARPVF